MFIKQNDDAKHENKVRQDVAELEKGTKGRLDEAHAKVMDQDGKDRSAPPNTRHPERIGNTPHPEREGNKPHPERAGNHIPEKDYPSSPFPD